MYSFSFGGLPTPFSLHLIAFYFLISLFFIFPPAKYIGCYVDDIQKRALRGVSFFDYKKMTVFRCQDNCAERYAVTVLFPPSFLMIWKSFEKLTSEWQMEIHY